MAPDALRLFKFAAPTLALLPILAPADAHAQDEPHGANLAVVAKPSASFTSGDTSVSAMNDGIRPRRSRGSRGGSYGNWPRRGTQWVQYEWEKPITTERTDVFWWDDRRGVRLPEACRLLYWKDGEFAPVPEAEGLGVEADEFNTTTFPAITTTRLRLEIDSSGENSTGVLEWRVYDNGESPPFPPTVETGMERVVVLGGKTYLSGEVNTLSGGAETETHWAKVSGPGEVDFADPHAIETTATFSEVGEYVLKLTAADRGLESSSTLKVTAKPAPEGEPLHYVSERRFKVTNPLWKQRLKAVITSWIPHCYQKIDDPNLREGGINNFIDAAAVLDGEPPEEGEERRHRGYTFSNAWVYNTMESMCLALMVDPQGDQEIIDAQKEIRAKLEEWIPIILAAQEDDGYLQTRHTIEDRDRWTYLRDHEGYVAGYFLEAAIAMYVLTDGEDTRLYDAGRRLADCWCKNIGPPPKKAWYDGHQEMEQALVRFGNFVNEIEGGGEGDKYIELAKFLLDNRGYGEERTEYDQSHVPVVQQYEAVGHAVRAAYSYSGMADIAVEHGDLDYQSAVESLWDNIVNKKYYVTGGIGSGETSEGFGPNYSLRHNAYCESCSGTGELYFQHKLNRLHAHGKYADLFEETLYNAILGDLDLEGENFYYQNPLTARGPRYDWHGCPCCVGNIPRTFLRLPTWTYMTADDGLYVNLFVGCEVELQRVAGGDIRVVQDTDYPWSGDVSIKLYPGEAREFALRVRSPDRDVSELYTATPNSDGIESLSVNGKAVDINVEDGYAVIRRQWEDGDEVQLKLPMKVQRVHASDKIEATRGQVALRRGPLIYNFESVDQDVGDVALPPDAELSAEWRPDLLQGVVAITGQFANGTPLLAIPNYARMNRLMENPESDEGEGRRRRGGGVRSVVWIEEATGEE